MSGLESVRETRIAPSSNLTPNPPSKSSDIAIGPVYRPDERDKAIHDFDRELESEGLHTGSRDYLSQALLLIDNGDYKNAQMILRAVLEKDPHFADAIRWQGYCLKQLGDFPNSLKCFQEWARLQPNEESYSAVAEACYSMGLEAEAIQYYEKALALIDYESPHLFEIYKNLGNICLRAGNFDAAEENYNRAFTLSPHSDALLVNYGTLALQKNELDEAGERFRSAVELNQNNDKAWTGLALVSRKKSDFELAWGNIEKALDINSKNIVALRIAVEWSFEDYRFDPSIRRLTEYLAENGQDLDMSYSLAGLFYKAGRVGEASIEIERVLSLDPAREDALELRNIIAERLSHA